MRWLIGVTLAIVGCGGSVLTDDLLGDASPQDAAPDATIVDTGIDVSIDAPPVDACATNPTCSPDLHSVVDCNNQVISTCAVDQGCSSGVCVDACVANDNAAQSITRPSTPGCAFYGVVPDVLANNNLEGGCYAVALTNAWTAPMTVSVDRAGTTLTGDFIRIPTGSGSSMTYAALTNGQVPAGATALLFLSHSTSANPQCPAGITPAITTDPAVHGTAYGDAFHITTTMPSYAADYVPYGAGAYIASASVLLPTHAWDVNFIVVDAYAASSIAGGVPSTDIVAMQDNTQVEILPIANIVGSGTVTAATSGTLTTYQLAKGQILQFTQNADLTGSVIEANNPIGVWGAHTCMNIDLTTTYCDSAHQQLLADEQARQRVCRRALQEPHDDGGDAAVARRRRRRRDHAHVGSARHGRARDDRVRVSSRRSTRPDPFACRAKTNSIRSICPRT